MENNEPVWGVKLAILKLSVLALIAYATKVFNKMTGTVGPPPIPNSYFNSPNPLPGPITLAILNGHITALNNAYNSTVLSGKEKTTAIKNAKATLISDLKSMGDRKSTRLN